MDVAVLVLEWRVLAAAALVLAPVVVELLLVRAVLGRARLAAATKRTMVRSM